MKNLITSLVFILGMGLILSTTSCDKHKTWEELEHIVVDIYKQQGSAHFLIDFITKEDEEFQLKEKESFRFLRSEVSTVTVTALEDNTTVRIHGQIIYLDKEDKYIWYSVN